MEHSHVRFLGNLVLSLWDCGGQTSFMDNYLNSQRDNIFQNVEVLIYVFDIESREMETDMLYFRNCIEALSQLSRNARIFCLIHKVDLLPAENRELVLTFLTLQLIKDKELLIKKKAEPFIAQCFPTSIWDETLYKVLLL